MSADDVQHPSGTNEFTSPRTIGNYVLEELLGGSEYSSTFRGTKQGSHEAVAIKVFSKTSSIAKELYESEIKAYQALRGQAGILQYKDDGETDKFHFIVTEFVKEGSLRQILQDCPEGMKIEDVIKLFTPIAAAIDCIHENNIVHRDLKPENILIRTTDREYQVFVADFGFVKFTSASKQFQTEKTAGTWKYIPPEAWKADPNTPQTKAVDIYALGIMLYEALEGNIPYADIGEVLSNKPVLSPARTLQNTDVFVVEFLLRAIHKEPDQRPTSAKAVIEGIRNAYEGNLSADQKWLGRRIKHYVVEEVLGAGRMGISLRARDTQANRQVVLKAFTRSISGNAIQAYDKEKKSLDRLQNGHGVLIPHDRFEHEGYFFIVTEYQSGGTLRNLLNRKPKLPTNEIMELFTQIAEAIDYIHDRKVIHRDIKPENIVYNVTDEKINPFITDFGVSVILASTQSSFRTHEIGTPRYMAPELWDSNARGTKAVDIYAFGIMLYEALEGHPPFEADAPAIIKHHLYMSVPVPEKTWKELGIHAKNVLLQALAKDAVERPKTAGEVMQQIKGQHAMFLGKKYGKYIIEKFVGRGTYGATYRAFDRNKNQRKKFAFKVLTVPEPMMHEVEVLKNLDDYDGIVPIIDGNSENGIHYIVTEYLNGLNLRDMLQSYRQGMSLDDVLNLFKPIARALDYLHHNNVIHGDLKPENIILLKNRNEENSFDPFLTGFGISKIAGKVQSFHSKSNINYLAPELWEENDPSRASDIFALGVILYETLVGVPPFDAKSPAELMKKYFNDAPPDIRTLTKAYGRIPVQALLQALDKKPEHRQKYAQELIAGLEKRETARRTSTTDGRISGEVLATLHSILYIVRRNLTAVLAGLLLLTVVAFGAYLFRTVSAIPVTGDDTPLSTVTLGAGILTENPAPAQPDQPSPKEEPTDNIVHPPAGPAVRLCRPNYSAAETGWPKDYRSTNLIAVEELYRQYYGRKRDNQDLYAFVYYNNRQVIETGVYHFIDPGRLSIERGWTIFLPPPSWIDEYKKFPAPVLENPPNNLSSTILFSGSSTLSPLSEQVVNCFEAAEANKTFDVQIDMTNTRSGLTEFCQSAADLFVGSENITLEMRRESGCPDVELLQFPIAKYAVVIYINDSNPYAQQLQQDPLDTNELEKLLFSAETWGEVREGLGTEPILRYFPPEQGGIFEIVTSEITPTVDPASGIKGMITFENPTSIPQEVANHQFSIGFSGFGDYQSLRGKLIAIPIGQVLPNVETIQGEDAIYPLTRSLSLYTGQNTFANNPLLQYFINYYLAYELDFMEELGYFHPDTKNLLNADYYYPRSK